MARDLSAADLQAEQAKYALERVREAGETGKVTLSDPMTGTTRVLDALSPNRDERALYKEMLSHFRSIALASWKRRTRTDMPKTKDDFTLGETR